jgi:hypothetical protein
MVPGGAPAPPECRLHVKAGPQAPHLIPLQSTPREAPLNGRGDAECKGGAEGEDKTGRDRSCGSIDGGWFFLFTLQKVCCDST